jgi:hypothetical protein
MSPLEDWLDIKPKLGSILCLSDEHRSPASATPVPESQFRHAGNKRNFRECTQIDTRKKRGPTAHNRIMQHYIMRTTYNKTISGITLL